MRRLAFALLLFAAAPADAPPGRPGKDGCHDVHQDFEYKDGRTVKAGSRHCHRLLGEMTLDGKEHLQDKPHEHRDEIERCADIMNDPNALLSGTPGSCLWLDR